MRLAIYTKGESYFTAQDLNNMVELGEKYSLDLIYNSEFAAYSMENYGKELPSYDSIDNFDVDFVLSVGGDGTFLHCVAMLASCDTPILGVNSGRLGFLSSVDKNSIEFAIKSLIDGEYSIEKRSTIAISGDFGEKNIFPYIFNEFTLQKSELNMVEITIEIDGRHVATVSADGMIVSTPSGSTAYSLSSGGAILSPNCKAFIITPIAPHNLTMRPIVVDDSAEITMRVESRIGECYATLDNRSYKVKSHSTFQLKLSPYKVSLVKLKGESFFDTLRKKLMWGSESRY